MTFKRAIHEYASRIFMNGMITLVTQQIVVAKDTRSATVKLATEIEESTPDVTDYEMVFHSMTCSRDELRRAVLSFHLSAD